MKKFIVIYLINLFFLSAWAQDVQVRVAEVQFNSTSQDGINLSDTYGEGIVGSESNEGIFIVHSFYSGVIPDSINSVKGIEPITGLNGFPNPTHDGIVLTSDDQQHLTYDVSLLTENGSFLRREFWRSGIEMVKIDLKQIPAGKYYFTVKETASGKQSSLAIIKQ